MSSRLLDGAGFEGCGNTPDRWLAHSATYRQAPQPSDRDRRVHESDLALMPHFVELDEIPARVVEDGHTNHAHVGGL
jgi:hypothetical protein